MFPIKYIDNNLVWNKDNEVFAYYELIPYNYSFLSAEQKFIVHDSFRQLIAQSREGKIHALQIATESSIRSMQEQSKKLVTGKLKEVAYQKIDEQTEALVSMIGDNQVDYRFFLGFKLISMYVDKGEFVAIMGASGSGKTTLLNCISTIDTVTSGHITVNNQDITKIKDKDFADFRRENLGFIFQDFNLLDTLTIGENISLSLVINKQNPTDIEKRVHAIADKLGIRDILSKFPYEVSGGQKQRCACARALINEPKLILADEPTGALDSKASRLLLETMSEINKKMQATILMVTHDPFSASFCERILFLKDGKIFNEIFRGEKSRKDFFNEILDILTLLGGEVGNVR